MRVFKDLELVEHLGTGIRKILKRYDRSFYHFYPHFITVSINFNKNEFKYKTTNISLPNLTTLQENIIKLIMDKPNITQPQMANMLGVNERTIRNHLKHLIEYNYIIRVGAKKNGEWIINSNNNDNNNNNNNNDDNRRI